MRVFTSLEIQSVLNWESVLDAMRTGHQGARPIGDSYFIGDSEFGLFSRGVILPGVGAGFKTVTMHPKNSDYQPPLPTEHGTFLVLDERTKAFLAMMDGPEITRWKTAADSALAAEKLSKKNSEVLLVLGAGPIASALIEAYLHIRPSIREVKLWNRTRSKLQPFYEKLKQQLNIHVNIVDDLDEAVGLADIISSATSSKTANIKGKLLRPGTHVDVVGGYREDMQEVDVEAFPKTRVFVDDIDNALISGDLSIPIAEGVFSADMIEGDLFDLCQNPNFLRSDEDITIYKNAGGAYLDLIVSQRVLDSLSL